MKLRAFQVATVALGLMIGLVLTELGLWWVLPLERLRYIHGRSRTVFQYDPANVRFDPRVGFAGKPNRVVPFENWEFSTTVATNRMGFRDDDRSLDNPDILFLGDSFAFGWGVEKDQSVEGCFENATRLKVLNLAFPGYGTNQEILTLFDVAERLNLRGKTAVFWFYINDPYDNRGTGFDDAPRTLFRQGKVSFTPPTPTGFADHLTAVNAEMNHGLARRSLVADQLARAFEKLRERVLGPRSCIPRCVPAEPEASADVHEMLERTIELLTSFARERSLKVAFVFVPAIGHPDLDQAYRKLAAVLSRQRVPLLDLRPMLTEQDYYPIDGHWTASGHRKAAASAARWLTELGLLPAPPAAAPR